MLSEKCIANFQAMQKNVEMRYQDIYCHYFNTYLDNLMISVKQNSVFP